MRKEDPTSAAKMYLTVAHHLVMPAAGVTVRLPSETDELSWSNFLYWLDNQPSPLFGAAGKYFASGYPLLNVPAKMRTQTSRISIGQHDLLIARW